MTIPEKLLGTLTGRWYVFVFLAVYLWIAVHQIGLRRTVLFTLIVWPTAFLSEYSSIRTGFPYGWYEYLPDGFADRELWIGSGKLAIPFFDSLSYTFLNYTGYATALFLTTPRLTDSWNVQLALTNRGARGLKLLVTAAAVTMLLDVIIDPIAQLGDRWFLGKIYRYPHGGVYFGVPLSNFVGWWLTSAAAVGIYMAVDALWGGVRMRPRPYLPVRGLWAPALWLGTAAFNIVVTFVVAARAEAGEQTRIFALAGFSTLIAVALAVWVFRRLRDPGTVATAEERAAHFADFPDRPLARRLGLDRAGAESAP